jgi:two-component system, LuxR family, sensor kinase FixL
MMDDQATAIAGALTGSALTRTILQAAPHAIMMVDAAGRVKAINESALSLFAHAGEAPEDLRVESMLPEVRFVGGPVWTGEDGAGAPVPLGVRHRLTGLRGDGRQAPLIAVFGEAQDETERLFSVFVIDLTDRAALDQEVQSLREELIHAGRVGEMAEMASAIAHEVAQPMSAAKNYLFALKLAMARPQPDGGRKLEELVSKVDAEIDRASGILGRLRNFMRKAPPTRSTHDLNEIVHEAAVLASTGAARLGIRLAFDLAPARPKAIVDKVQVQQVMVNLVRNAIDALETSNDRLIRVRTRDEPTGLVVEVADTGPGLPDSVLARLFEPFTTTKKDGMGLGLSISRRIMEGHGGALEAENQPGGGALFRMRLPHPDRTQTDEASA